MYLRHFLRLLLVIILLGGVVGCGGYGGKKGDNEGKDQPKPAAKTTSG